MRYLLFALLLLGFQKSNAQEVRDHDPRGFFIKVEPGIWMPLGDLRKTFNSSANMAMWFELQAKDWKVEIGVGGVFNPVGQFSSFNYSSVDTNFVANQGLGIGYSGIRVSKVRRLSSTSFFVKSLGIGQETISTGVKRLKTECEGYSEEGWHLTDKKCEGDKKYKKYDVGSFYLSAGVGLEKVVFRNKLMGVHIDYRFAPYPWFKHVDKGFGNSALSAGLSFRFD